MPSAMLHQDLARAIVDERLREANQRRLAATVRRANGGSPPGHRRSAVLGPAIALGIALLAASQLGAAGWMVAAPHSFFRVVGPFGPYNGHYLFDAAAFTGGLGAALALSLRWPSLRAGTLAVSAAMTGLHAINHWADLSSAHAGSGAGLLDATMLTIAFGFVAALAVVATRERAT